MVRKKDWQPGDVAWMWDKNDDQLIRVVVDSELYRNRYAVIADGENRFRTASAAQLSVGPVPAIRREIKRKRDTAKSRDQKIRSLMNEKHRLLFRAQALEVMAAERAAQP